MIRNPTEEDIDELKKLHEQFFQSEFSFDDFISGSMYNFIIKDDNDSEIITGASVRPIAEMTAITNLNKSPRIRRHALYELLEVARYILRPTTMQQLHVFIQNQDWERQLIKSGFRRTKGNALVIDI